MASRITKKSFTQREKRIYLAGKSKGTKETVQKVKKMQKKTKR